MARIPRDGLDPAQEKYLENTMPLYKGVITKAFLGISSPKAAIKAHCLSCTSDERKMITICQITTCPLHYYRPYQNSPVGVDSEVDGAEEEGADSEDDGDDEDDTPEVAPVVVRASRRVRAAKGQE